MMKTSKKTIVALLLGVIVLAIFIAYEGYLASCMKEDNTTVAAPFLTGTEIRDPKKALRYGIKGYIEVSVEEGTPLSLSIKKGGQQSITLLMKFVSYDPNFTETKIDVNPDSGNGLSIEQCYALVNEEGEIYARGTIDVSKLVTYEPSGEILVKAGETVRITLTITIPPDYPTGVAFPLGPIGIVASVPLLSEVSVMVYA
jgi:hypothetical protein